MWAGRLESVGLSLDAVADVTYTDALKAFKHIQHQARSRGFAFGPPEWGGALRERAMSVDHRMAG